MFSYYDVAKYALIDDRMARDIRVDYAPREYSSF